MARVILGKVGASLPIASLQWVKKTSTIKTKKSTISKLALYVRTSIDLKTYDGKDFYASFIHGMAMNPISHERLARTLFRYPDLDCPILETSLKRLFLSIRKKKVRTEVLHQYHGVFLKLEQLWGLDSGFLINRLPTPIVNRKDVKLLTKMGVFLHTLKKIDNERPNFSFKELSTKQNKEIDSVSEYKSDPELRHQQKIPLNKTSKSKKSRTYWGEYTEASFRYSMGHFYRWLISEKDQNQAISGYGLDADKLSVSLMTDVHIIEEYNGFMAFRCSLYDDDESSVKYTTRVESFLTMIISFCRKETGYFRAHPEYVDNLLTPINCTWDQHLDSVREKLVDFLSHDEVKIQRVRNSIEELQPVLSLKNPLKLFNGIIYRIGEDIEKAHPEEKPKYSRLRALLALCLSAPLRVRQITTIELGDSPKKGATVLIKNAGQFKRVQSGSWVLVAHKNDFKNRKFLEEEFYQWEIPHWFTNVFDQYVNNYRKTIKYRNGIVTIDDENIYLFPSDKCEGFLTRETLTQLMKRLTNSYFPEDIKKNLPYMRPHQFRHLIATVIASDDTLADKWGVVARMLNDQESTVRTVYGRPDHGQLMSAFINSNYQKHFS